MEEQAKYSTRNNGCMMGNDFFLNNQNLIIPFQERNVSPASYDLTIAAETKSLDTNAVYIGNNFLNEYKDKPLINGYIRLAPGEFALSSTREWVIVPPGMCAEITGRSSVGRLGLSVHITAGFIDPGFKGRITLELKNETDVPIYIKPGSRICQIKYFTVDQCSATYQGKYLFQKNTKESMAHLDTY